MKSILYYVHDPMCSWCWGFSQTLTHLLDALPGEVEVQRLLGGLAPDSDDTMSEALQQSIKDNWYRIEDKISNVKFNFGFWEECTPRRSTYPACRAIIAARQQGAEYDVKMTNAIQRAYYQEARNPSNISTLIELAQELNLSKEIFEKDLKSDETKNIFNKEMDLSREIYADSYPSLVLAVAEDNFTININYNDSQTMLKNIKKHLIDYRF